MRIDVLAFGVHPDDVELGCGGILIQEKLNGKTTGIIDLTQGELGTRGSVAKRKTESAAAARILKLDVRENLKMDDGFFENNKANKLKIIEVIRKYKPEIILCNAPEDRHPDHGRSSQMVEDAAFLSGLMKIITKHKGKVQEQHRPKYVFNYLQDRYLTPSFVYDISEVFEQKMEAMKAYGSQFYNPKIDEAQTYISTPSFMDSIEYRSKMLGKMIGVAHAEGLIGKK